MVLISERITKHNGTHENHNKCQRLLATKSSATTTFKAIGSLRPILQIPGFPGVEAELHSNWQLFQPMIQPSKVPREGLILPHYNAEIIRVLSVCGCFRARFELLSISHPQLLSGQHSNSLPESGSAGVLASKRWKELTSSYVNGRTHSSEEEAELVLLLPFIGHAARRPKLSAQTISR